MASPAFVLMEQRPTEHRDSGQQPRGGTSSIIHQFDLSNSKLSHQDLSSTQLVAVHPEIEIYEEHESPLGGQPNLHSGRNSDLDYILTSLNLDNAKAPLPLIGNENPYDSPEELFDYPMRPRESVSPLNTSRRPSPSILERLIMSSSSTSSSGSVPRQPPPPPPPPRSPPGPGPGATPRSSSQVLELDQISPTRKLFSVKSTPHLNFRSRSRQPQRKETYDDIWERVKTLRAEVWGLRSKIAENRNILRELGLAKAVADDKFMKFIRTHSLANLRLQDQSKEKEALAKLFEECEKLRNDYGPLEDDCNILESLLNNQEYEMQKLEAMLDEHWKHAPLSQQEIESPQSSASPSNYSGSELSQDYHPLVAEYLSKLGDVEIFHERLEWHIEEKLNLDEEKATKKRVNRTLADADQGWLDNYADAETDLKKRLQEAEEEAEKLRMKCYSLGLIDEDGEPLDFERQERQTFVADEVDAGTEKSDFVKFPILLPVPGNKEIPEHLPPTDVNEEGINIQERIDPGDRINHWLLQTLRSSPLDVNLLVRTFEAWVGHIIESERWQIEVLKVWYNDGSKEMATQYSRSLSEVVTHSKQKTIEQPTSLPGRQSIGIMMRTSTPRPAKWEEEAAINSKESKPPLPFSIVRKEDGKTV
ncbi:hypothetical protein N431DRAFT_429251 [Stipitochalara longipes BDJ]|nr:hypothetical protein N431DRAFT_429251 [Stipitochalara longipes BDJ]